MVDVEQFVLVDAGDGQILIFVVECNGGDVVAEVEVGGGEVGEAGVGVLG